MYRVSVSALGSVGCEPFNLLTDSQVLDWILEGDGRLTKFAFNIVPVELRHYEDRVTAF